MNEHCQDLFKNLGMIHETSCPYSLQQNGVVERKHKYLLEVAKALRLEANVPLKFRSVCILTVCYLINLMPNPILKDLCP